MSFTNSRVLVCISVLFVTAMAGLLPPSVAAALNPQDSPKVDELKTKLAKNQPVTIIDVRATGGLSSSDSKIKGAIYVKLRRLRSRLAFPPLKGVPRDREIVTYCACPNDESSVYAAQVLLDAGFKRVRALKGGWTGWQKAKGQIESVARGI